MAGQGRQTRGSTLFLAALLVSALQWGVQIAGQKLLFGPGPTDFSAPSFMLRDFLLAELAPFLVNPVLLFFVLYRLGKNVSLSDRYRAVAGLLFLGGVVGSGLSYYLLLVALGGRGWEAAFPSLLSLVATVAGFTYLFVSFGLATLFPGFVAIAVANFRPKSKEVPGQHLPTNGGHTAPREITEAV